MAQRKNVSKRMTDLAYHNVIGDEPVSINCTNESEITKALNWYNYMKAKEDSSKYIETWMKAKKGYTVKQIKAVSSLINTSKVTPTTGFMAKIALNHDMPDTLNDRILDRVKNHLEKHKEVKEARIEASSTPKKSVHDYVVEGARLVIDKLDDALADVFSGKTTKVELYALMREDDLKGTHARVIKDWLERVETEINAGEGYEIYGKRILNKVLLQIESFKNDADTVINNSKRRRIPRRKKTKTVAKQVSDVSYLERDDDLKIVSVPPSKVVDAEAVWLYDVKNKKLTVLIAEIGQRLSFKSKTTIGGFDPAKSGSKRCSKDEVIQEIVKMTKPRLKKVFDTIKSKKQDASGRLNANTLILRRI